MPPRNGEYGWPPDKDRQLLRGTIGLLVIPSTVAEIGGKAFWGCTGLTAVTIPGSVTSIGENAFEGCTGLTTLLISSAAAAVDASESNARALNDEMPLAQITRIWAPDHIINQLAGPFNDYSTFAEVPRLMQAAADATTWAGVQLWLWWSDPQEDAGEGRVLCPSRQQMVWTVMHVALRLETTSTSATLADVLPPEMWMLIMTFVKHEQPPT